jgi:hypothetical protein
MRSGITENSLISISFPDVPCIVKIAVPIPSI